MNTWHIDVEPYTMDEVQIYCVQDLNWQAYRKSLKNLSTSEKLRHLYQRLYDAARLYDDPGTLRRFKVQADNYVNALKRGGFLDGELNVIK